MPYWLPAHTAPVLHTRAGQDRAHDVLRAMPWQARTKKDARLPAQVRLHMLGPYVGAAVPLRG